MFILKSNHNHWFLIFCLKLCFLCAYNELTNEYNGKLSLTKDNGQMIWGMKQLFEPSLNFNLTHLRKEGLFVILTACMGKFNYLNSKFCSGITLFIISHYFRTYLTLMYVCSVVCFSTLNPEQSNKSNCCGKIFIFQWCRKDRRMWNTGGQWKKNNKSCKIQYKA